MLDYARDARDGAPGKLCEVHLQRISDERETSENVR